MKFSANLGFLFTELSLPDAIHAAADAGFDAVECHFPYDTDPAAVTTALGATGLPMLGLNTWPGDRAAGDFGLAALPARRDAARQAIDDAIAYARATGTRAVHVMAGRGETSDDAFADALRHACARAAPHDITILIEPINTRDVPGYHLSSTDHAEALIARVAAPNLKIMFDAYHLQIMQGDLTRSLERLLPQIGHIQIAAVPDRGEPDRGEVNYLSLLGALAALGWTAPIGAEYRPRGTTAKGLGWLASFRKALD